MASSIDLKKGYKFAVLALSHPRAEGPSVPLIAVDHFAVTTSLPDGALETWRNSIATIHQRELSENSLFLWASQPSVTPGVLDGENEQLRREAFHLYLGLLVAVPYFSFGRVTSLTGANDDGTARVRSLTTYPRTFFTLGSPTPSLTSPRVKLAATLGTSILAHQALYGQSRFTRCLRTFREATELGTLDERLHQFARCAEGFAAPPFRKSGKEFAQRLSRVCVGHTVRQLEEMYTIRGGIEHLHGPYDRLPRSMSKRKRVMRLLVRTVQAEALARFLLHTYLVNPQLWPHFQERSTIDAFWNLGTRQLRRLFPVRLHFPSIKRGFDVDAVNQQTLTY